MKNRNLLTPREKEVISLAAKGKSRKEIGKDLSINEETVKTHLSSVRRKFNVDKTIKAIVIAQSENLICV